MPDGTGDTDTCLESREIDFEYAPYLRKERLPRPVDWANRAMKYLPC